MVAVAAIAAVAVAVATAPIQLFNFNSIQIPQLNLIVIPWLRVSLCFKCDGAKTRTCASKVLSIWRSNHIICDPNGYPVSINALQCQINVFWKCELFVQCCAIITVLSSMCINVLQCQINVFWKCQAFGSKNVTSSVPLRAYVCVQPVPQCLYQWNRWRETMKLTNRKCSFAS